MRYLLFPILYFVLIRLCFSYSSNISSQDKNYEHFIENLYSNHKKLKGYYDNVVFRGKLYYGERNLSREYVALEGMFKIQDEAPNSIENKKQGLAGKIYLISQKYYCEIEKRQLNSDYVLISNYDKVPSKISQSLFIVSPYASFMFLGRSLPDWLNDPGFRIISTSYDAEKSTAELSFSYSPNFENRLQNDYPYMHGRFTFDTNNKWSIIKVDVAFFKEMENRIKKEYKQIFIINHEIKYEDVMMPKIIEQRMIGIERPVLQYQVEELVKVQLHKEDFTLTAFGLPEPVGVEWERPVRWYLWLMLAGVVCLVAGGVFYWLSRRRAGGTN